MKWRIRYTQKEVWSIGTKTDKGWVGWMRKTESGALLTKPYIEDATLFDDLNDLYRNLQNYCFDAAVRYWYDLEEAI